MVVAVVVLSGCEGRSVDKGVRAPGTAATLSSSIPTSAKSGAARVLPSPLSSSGDTRQRNVEIAVVGPYLPFDEKASDETNPDWWRNRADNRWKALCDRRGVVEVVETEMRFVAGEVDGDKRGIVVSASGCSDTLVLVRGLSVSTGAVSTARVSHKPVPSPKEKDTTWEVFFLGRPWRLYFKDATGLPLMVSNGAHAQELRNWKDAAAEYAGQDSGRHDWGFASQVKLLWAGDLNRDGGLDLLLKQGDAETGVSVELFLSTSGSTEPNLVLADRFSFGAC